MAGFDLKKKNYFFFLTAFLAAGFLTVFLAATFFAGAFFFVAILFSLNVYNFQTRNVHFLTNNSSLSSRRVPDKHIFDESFEKSDS